jgi:hypothetical protein
MKKKRTQRTIPFDTTKTLEYLENSVWDKPTGFITGLILNSHRLRKIPVQDLTVENLRMLIGQQIGLKFLMPLALEILKANPLAEGGSFFEGDLLCSVLRVSPEFWMQYPYWRKDLAPVVATAGSLIEQKITDDPAEWEYYYQSVLEEIAQYERTAGG